MLNPRKLITLDQAPDKSEALRNAIKGLLPLYVLNPTSDEFISIRRCQIQEYYDRQCKGNYNDVSLDIADGEEVLATVILNDNTIWLDECKYTDALVLV